MARPNYTIEATFSSIRSRFKVLSLGIFFLCTSCAPALMLDVDGRPVVNAAYVASAERARLVVDTNVTPWRAVLEVEVDAPEGVIRGSAWVANRHPALVLRLTERHTATPTRVVTSTPLCPPSMQHIDAHVRGSERIRVHGRWERPTSCYQIVRAEFVIGGPQEVAGTVRLTLDRRVLSFRLQKSVTDRDVLANR